MFSHCSAIVNNAAMKICVQVFAWIFDYSSLGIYLGIELLGHIVTVYFAF